MAQPSISVVDDDYSVRRSVARLLLSCGLEVETFASANEYLESEHPKGVACLILDVYLDGMSGIDLYQTLQSSGHAPPVIFITAHDDESTLAHIRGHVAAACLRKPFDSSTLLTELGHILDRDFE